MNKYYLLLTEVHLGNIIKKLNIFSLVFVIAYFFNYVHASFLESLFNFIGFVIFYSAVYYYNDIKDYEYDKKRKPIPRQKLLAKGIFSKREYSFFFILSLVVGGILLYLSNFFLLLLTLLLIILNIARTNYIHNLTLRAISLTIIQVINFVAFWAIITKKFIEVSAIPLSFLYGIIYSFAYYIYRKNKKIRYNHLKVISVPIIISLYFSLPIFLWKNLFIVLVIGGILYIIPPSLKRKDSINKLITANTIGILISTIFFLSCPLYEKVFLTEPIIEKVPNEVTFLIYTKPKQILMELNNTFLDVSEGVKENLTNIFLKIRL